MLSGTVSQLRAVPTDDRTHANVATQVAAAVEPGPALPFATGAAPAVMGILNVTPDSFYDGGEYDRLDAAVDPAEEMVAAGADVVNDVSGLSDPEMRFVVADHDAALVLMHSLSAPVDPDRSVTYDDVVDDVLAELSEQVLHAERAGIDREQILVDPGVGFGKSATESFELLDRLGELRALGCPVMLGHSRKSMFERAGADSGDRLPPTLAATTMAVERGADVVRVHDVAENAAVVRTAEAARDTRRQ